MRKEQNDLTLTHFYKWFTSSEHARLFIERGEILFRSSKYFRNCEALGIADKSEAKISVTKPNLLHSKNGFNITDISIEFDGLENIFIYSLSKNSNKMEGKQYFVKIDAPKFIELVRSKALFRLIEKEMKTGHLSHFPVKSYINLYRGDVLYKANYSAAFTDGKFVAQVSAQEMQTPPFFIKDASYANDREYRFVIEFTNINKRIKRMTHSNKFCLASLLGNLGNICLDHNLD